MSSSDDAIVKLVPLSSPSFRSTQAPAVERRTQQGRSRGTSLLGSLDSDIEQKDSEQHDQALPRIISTSSSKSKSTSSSPSIVSTELLPIRPNKFSGPASTWRSWIISDRQLATSLDQLNARDVSAHLYNAYALKRRAIGPITPRKRSLTNDELETDISGEEQEGAQRWVPPKSWTTWPMAPSIVPREGEDQDWDSRYVHQARHRSRGILVTQRQVLEDVLTGEVQKQAKQRFCSRNARDVGVGFVPVGYHTDPDRLELEPVVLADDDTARHLLAPSIHHILAKLDDLLTGLHHARYAYMAVDESSSESQYHSGQGSSSARKMRKWQPVHPRLGKESIESFKEPQTSPPKVERKPQRERVRPNSRQSCSLRKRKYHSGLRDWSDVLGIASMTGWEPGIVQRAATRCAALFDENMTFRTLEENGKIPDTSCPRPKNLIMNTSSHLHGSQGSQFGPSSVPPKVFELHCNDSTRWRFHCPVPECNRSKYGFSEAYRLRRHVVQVHKGLIKSELTDQSNNAMYGCIHVDGFLQSIPAPPKSWGRKIGSRRQPSGLYQ